MTSGPGLALAIAHPSLPPGGPWGRRDVGIARTASTRHVPPLPWVCITRIVCHACGACDHTHRSNTLHIRSTEYTAIVCTYTPYTAHLHAWALDINNIHPGVVRTVRAYMHTYILRSNYRMYCTPHGAPLEHRRRRVHLVYTSLNSRLPAKPAERRRLLHPHNRNTARLVKPPPTTTGPTEPLPVARSRSRAVAEP